MTEQGLANSSARLFSNPAGDYGSMVNERVGSSEWEDDTWASRNAFWTHELLIIFTMQHDLAMIHP